MRVSQTSVQNSSSKLTLAQTRTRTRITTRIVRTPELSFHMFRANIRADEDEDENKDEDSKCALSIDDSQR